MIFTNVRRIAIHVPLKGFANDVLLCNRTNVSVIRVVSLYLSYPGVLSLGWTVVFWFFTADSPSKHPSISREEREQIEAHTGDVKVGVTFLTNL